VARVDRSERCGEVVAAAGDRRCRGDVGRDRGRRLAARSAGPFSSRCPRRVRPAGTGHAGGLDRLELTEFADRKLGRLSGGERQRLVIARALATEAPILLLDEPTSALDIGHQQQALELVARLRADHGLTVVSAMHDLTLAGMYADRLVLLHEGVVVSSGPPEEVLRPETLAEFYGVRVSVHREPDGTLVVIPRRDLP
jgi:ABC-type cobalamin/Fe3+-siderophores transport system ATPase subunit